jgi:WhiB family redox-sensing transcriptional regulator
MPAKNIGNGSLDWERQAECAKPENKAKQDFFFSADPEEKYQAKNLCFTCPVRAECLKFALEHKQIWWIWGGRDENEIRRTLSLDAEGNETRRGRYPQCGYCGARTSRLTTKVVDLPNGGRWTTAKAVECTVCNFEWKSRSSANAVQAYHAERKAKVERREAARTKKS